jgi:small-conductance mechanosensitive channel/CRP-like cAMP-binding protein
MEGLKDLVHLSEVTSFGGVGIAIAVVLLLALRVLLARKERRHIRIPLGMLLTYVLVVVLRAIVPADSSSQEWLRVSGLFLILAAIGNAAFLLVIDWFVGQRLGRPLPRIFRDIVAIAVYAVVSIVTLRAVGVELGSLLTTSALLTAAIALSLQDTIGNLFAGLALEAQRPFVVGDWIQFDDDPDHIGRVTEINWRATKVLTNDRVEVIVPNGALAKMSIINFTQPTPISRRRIEVRAPLDVPPRLVQDTIIRAVEGMPQILGDPPPMVLVAGFEESAVRYDVYFHIDDFELRLRIGSLVRSRIWYGLTRAGIHIPHAVRDVRWRDTSREAETQRLARIAEREQDIRKVDFLDALRDEAIRELAELTDIRLFTAGEPIIMQGEKGDELFIVRSGEVAVVLEKDGQETEVARLGPGKFFGEMSLMTGERRSATVRALVECEMLVIGHEAFKSILLAHPNAAEHVSRSLSRRQGQLDERASALPEAHEPEADRESALLTRIRSFFKL